MFMHAIKQDETQAVVLSGMNCTVPFLRHLSKTSMIGPLYTFLPWTAQNTRLKMIAPLKTATDQFIVTAEGSTAGGQNEKNMPTVLYAKEATMTGTPARPSLNGP